MRVKRLEIQGFKSFKDKTVIHFDHNITGIVGPNGCGKSNIVDAFFWVMGEQSYKHMRGTSSEDLIFNGSSRYSALGLAEATLVMETGDTSVAPAGATTQDVPLLRTKEVSVTRRLYRSGEGEYLINGTLSRLKDIQELFMDTGVGTKGYSVIEQGQIGKIVNSKPEERRLLIEEAAGIAKYKVRKKESLRKMEATQANLARLTDIIQEIERSLASLDRQAQKAKQYKKYKDELFDKEITWGARKSKLLHQKVQLLRDQRDALEQELAGLKAQVQTDENAIEVEQVGLVTDTKEAEVFQAKMQEISNQLSDKRSTLELSKRRQGDLTSQLESMSKEEGELNLSIAGDQKRLEEFTSQIEEADYILEQSTTELESLNEAVNQCRQEAEEARNQVDQTQKALLQGMNQISTLNSKSAALHGKIELSKTQNDRLTAQEAAQNQKLTEVSQELEKTKSSIENLQEQKETLRTQREERSGALEEEEENFASLEKEKNLALRSLTETKSRLSSLEELDQSHEGLGDGPKAVLDWAQSQKKSSSVQAITDHLEVSVGYETALESWLENRLEHLIVYDSEIALPVLEQLRVHKLGRAGIQLLCDASDTSESDSKASPKTKTAGPKFAEIRSTLESNGFKVLGELSQFVKAKGPKTQTLNRLFSHVCVVDSSAPMTAFFQNHLSELAGWGLVSQDGIALEPHGLLRGGSLDATGAASILRRKKLIEELREQTEQKEIHFKSLEESYFESKEKIDLLRAQLKTIQSEYQQLEIQSAALSRDIHQIERAQKEATQHLASIQRESAEMKRQADQASTDLQTVDQSLGGLVESRSALEDDLASQQATSQEKEAALREQDSQLHSTRVREASLRERASSLKREIQAVRSVLADRERRKAEIQKVFERATQEKSQFTGKESELQESLEELTVALSVTRERFATVKDRIEQANSEVHKTLDKIKTLHKTIDQKSSESMKTALDMEKLSGELSHLIMNLEEKYGPGCLTPRRVGPVNPLLQRSVEAEDFDAENSSPEITSPENTLDDVQHDGENNDQAATDFFVADLGEISAEEELKLNEEVERLRERIRRLGEVNVMAIEEYEQLKKRYDHILTEKTDLERSLDNLKEAIDHINKTSEDRFKKAFEAIAERFEKLFPVIFGGGSASLTLIFPEGSKDILEAGVDITAQPPGKKVSNITLLSGGEKALTAVSLIFAIFMVKPSPFCVLDEVDAPLDDANIGRFNALLKEMSVKSQFILITHNKKTMELNDTLYGVTMEEPGVSKMVSIEMH